MARVHHQRRGEVVRLALALLLVTGCAAVKPSSVSVDVAAGQACYGKECGPNAEVRASATWEIK